MKLKKKYRERRISMDIESIRFIADQQAKIDSLEKDIENIFLMTKGLQKTMLCSGNEYVRAIAEFLMNQQEKR